MKLSIFLAGIRPYNWLALYESIPNATTLTDEEYELIFVGPYGLPPELQGKENVHFIEDWGCQSRCTQLGLLHSRGEYVAWVADDGLFSPTLAIDKAFDIIPKHEKGIVVLKYVEGTTTVEQIRDNPKKYRDMAQDESYWRLGGHGPLKKLPYVPNDYFLIMTALIRRDYLMKIGGWDCGFEQIGMGCPDLAIRLQNDGAEVIMGEVFTTLTHLPGRQGDHAPIHNAQMKNDLPRFEKMYSDPANANRSQIDFDNWKQTEEVWSRRFTPEDRRVYRQKHPTNIIDEKWRGGRAASTTK